MCLACAYQAGDLFDYLWIIREDHPDSPYVQDFVTSAHSWLTGCKWQYSTLLLELRTTALAPSTMAPHPSEPSPMVPLLVPDAPMASYAAKAASPCANHNVSAILPSCPNKP